MEISTQASTVSYTAHVHQDALRVSVLHMTLADIPVVMEIERTAFPRPWPETAYRYELSENPNAFFVVARMRERDFDRPAAISGWRKLVSLVHPSVVVSLPKSQVVGFAGMWMYVDEAHIATIATQTVFRGRGIGEALLYNLMREAQWRHAVSVTLEVRIGNTVAQSLYRKYDFEEVGRRKGYYQDNREDALLMTVMNFDTNAYRARLDELGHDLLERTMR